MAMAKVGANRFRWLKMYNKTNLTSRRASYKIIPYTGVVDTSIAYSISKSE